VSYPLTYYFGEMVALVHIYPAFDVDFNVRCCIFDGEGVIKGITHRFAHGVNLAFHVDEDESSMMMQEEAV